MSSSSLHFSVNIISRKQGRSTVACAAYRSDESLYDERNEREFRFKKHEVKPESFILAPSHAPEWVNDRQRLWNEVEKVEKVWTAQLSREVVVAIPNELNEQQQRDLIESFVKNEFVEKGMVADVCIHRDHTANPHAHIMLTMRPFNEDGSWGSKRPFTGERDEKGRKVFGTNPWDNRENVQLWRDRYQDLVNQEYQRLNIERRIDLRSYEKQGREEIPTVHLGHSVSAMEKKAKEEAQQKGVEYRPVTEKAQINQSIQQANEKIKEYNKDFTELDRKIVDFEEKKREIESDLKRSLEKSGYWNQMTDKEKISVMYVRNRMKEDVTLTVALKCQSQFENWGKSLDKKEEGLRKEIEDIKASKKLYESYIKAPENTLEKDGAQRKLGRLGFSVSNYKEELQKRSVECKKAIESYRSEKEKFVENKERVNDTVQLLKEVTIDQSRILYKNDAKLQELHPQEMDRLLQEFRERGRIIPLDQAKEFVHSYERQTENKQLSVVEQYDKFKKDNQFVVNWARSVQRKEKEAESLRETNPVEYAKMQQDIAKQKEAIAERVKLVKTSIHVLEKTMIAKVREQYPEQNWTQKLNASTARKILKLNEQEKRIVPVGEIMKHVSQDKQKNSSFYQDKFENSRQQNSKEPRKDFEEMYAKNRAKEELMNGIADSVKDLIDDSDKGRKSDIDRVLDENSRKSQSKNRGQGFSR
ncbi:MobQ family relaxase [Priestia endophytica]|uniref:MobA/MobL family protein n=1 Tax=Priestia endophytica DSM 13796 TaxID=1121089 RepID=A0A1I6C7A5_9BACI|nr:MobQ family relaxase [Priestia endophytica]KYG33496.1 hypothetical protein AZF06_21880 [Priestia endophytica]SFQ89063.1 MobA/MobL family protein [Priestia endophytica DSM 13796]